MRKQIMPALALLAMVVAGLPQGLGAQESLGERARRIRAEKENAAQNAAQDAAQNAGQNAGQNAAQNAGQNAAQSAAGQGTVVARKPAVPTAADLAMTASLAGETDAEKYGQGVRLLLEQERFRVLDDVAAADRAGKARFAGGEWKLWVFYNAIASPEGKGRGVVADWNAYRGRLGRWVAQQPGSITARISLAQAELLYAWQVRGAGNGAAVAGSAASAGANGASAANPSSAVIAAPAGNLAAVAGQAAVAQERQRLFAERLKAAETLLNQASSLREKCPEWYDVMLQVGRAEGWGAEDLNALLERAVAFEPQYFYVYQQQALALTPKERGQEGDAEKFAAQWADRVGGKPGDILYWQIAQAVLGDPERARMKQDFVWSRALLGYQAMIEQFGSSPARQNQIAFMAARFGDYMAADEMLRQVGDRWDPGTWGTQEYFEKVKAWARNSAGPFQKIVAAYQAVNLNIATPEGQRYDGQIAREFSARYARAVQDCNARSGGNAPTLLILQMARSGAVQQMLVVPETASDACLRPRLEKANFSPPPKPEYWVRVSLK